LVFSWAIDGLAEQNNSKNSPQQSNQDPILGLLPAFLLITLPLFAFTLQFTSRNCIALCTLPINLT
jgi:hypothetical protein